MRDDFENVILSRPKRRCLRDDLNEDVWVMIQIKTLRDNQYKGGRGEQVVPPKQCICLAPSDLNLCRSKDALPSGSLDVGS